MYRPLPDCLEIKDSKIHGQGVFAKEDINAHYFLGIAHHFFNDDISRTPLGGFLNHNPDNPNAGIVYNEENSVVHTLRKIHKGEEVTIHYRLYDI